MTKHIYIYRVESQSNNIAYYSSNTDDILKRRN